MLPLGEMLLERGWVDRRQLDEAVELQRRRGGRIGTCLLEQGSISEDLLIKTLSEQLAVPKAGVEDLRNVPRAVHRLLPAEVAFQRQVIPFRLVGQTVDIALLEVHDLSLHDEISFILGRKIGVHIANEARIFEALERYYGKPCPDRFASLLKRLNEARDTRRVPPAPGAGAGSSITAETPARSPDAGLAVPSPRLPSAEHAPPSPPRTGTDPEPPAVQGRQVPRSVPLTSEERRELAAGKAREDQAPSGRLAVTFDEESEMTLEQVEAGLGRVTSADEVGRLLLAYLSQQFLRVVLLRAGHDTVSGWMGRGPGVEIRKLESFRARLDQPSIFLNLSQGGSFFLGRLPVMELHTTFTSCWGEEPVHECLLLPIRLRERLVCLIYGDRDCLGLEGLDIGLLRKLAHKVSLAFEVCIMHQKLRRSRTLPDSPWPERFR